MGVLHYWEDNTCPGIPELIAYPFVCCGRLITSPISVNALFVGKEDHG